MIQPFASVVVVVNDEGKVLTVSRRGNPNDIGFPGGKREPNETPVTTAIRETKEETNIDVHSMVFLFEGHDAHGNLVHCWWARKWLGEPQQMEEDVSVRWSTWEELLAEDKTFHEYNAIARSAYLKARDC